jgi:pimeloyl-ACP methyl ester carboxylesterase
MPTPLFFGEEPRRLFGVYHSPSNGQVREQAVVLCPAGPQEYMLTHWAQRRLAALLSGHGIHVLRFDHFGVGDSQGSIEDGTLEQWQKDILTASEELRRLSGVRRTSLVGYRLGATLAWRASLAAAEKPRHLVLWDPVVRGKTYLGELRVTEDSYASQLLFYPPPGDPPSELYGYPLPRAQYDATAAIDLLQEPLPAATRVHMYVGRQTGETRSLASRLQEKLKRFTHEFVPEEGRTGSGNLLSKRVLDAIGGALSAEGG